MQCTPFAMKAKLWHTHTASSGTREQQAPLHARKLRAPLTAGGSGGQPDQSSEVPSHRLVSDREGRRQPASSFRSPPSYAHSESSWSAVRRCHAGGPQGQPARRCSGRCPAVAACRPPAAARTPAAAAEGGGRGAQPWMWQAAGVLWRAAHAGPCTSHISHGTARRVPARRGHWHDKGGAGAHRHVVEAELQLLQLPRRARRAQQASQRARQQRRHRLLLLQPRGLGLVLAVKEGPPLRRRLKAQAQPLRVRRRVRVQPVEGRVRERQQAGAVGTGPIIPVEVQEQRHVAQQQRVGAQRAPAAADARRVYPSAQHSHRRESTKCHRQPGASGGGGGGGRQMATDRSSETCACLHSPVRGVEC